MSKEGLSPMRKEVENKNTQINSTKKKQTKKGEKTMSFIVAIDGPAGTGKGTITNLISKELGLVNIDTGATYRCVALYTIRNNIKLEETQKIINSLKNIHISIEKRNRRGKSIFK